MTRIPLGHFTGDESAEDIADTVMRHLSLLDAEIEEHEVKHGGPGRHSGTGTPQLVHALGRFINLFNLNDGRGGFEKRVRTVADVVGVDPYDVDLAKLREHADEHAREAVSRFPAKSPCWLVEKIDFTVHRWLPGILEEKYPEIAQKLLDTSPRWGKLARADEGTLPLPEMKHMGPGPHPSGSPQWAHRGWPPKGFAPSIFSDTKPHHAGYRALAELLPPEAYTPKTGKPYSPGVTPYGRSLTRALSDIHWFHEYETREERRGRFMDTWSRISGDDLRLPGGLLGKDLADEVWTRAEAIREGREPADVVLYRTDEFDIPDDANLPVPDWFQRKRIQYVEAGLNDRIDKVRERMARRYPHVMRNSNSVSATYNMRAIAEAGPRSPNNPHAGVFVHINEAQWGIGTRRQPNDADAFISRLGGNRASDFWVPVATEDLPESLITHEFGHVLANHVPLTMSEEGLQTFGKHIRRFLENGERDGTVEDALGHVREMMQSGGWNRKHGETAFTANEWTLFGDESRGLKYGTGFLPEELNDVDGNQIAQQVSTYATKSHHELVAEAFAEYMLSPRPRPVAKYVGGFFDIVLGHPDLIKDDE